MSLGFEIGEVAAEGAIMSLEEKEQLQAAEEEVVEGHCSVTSYCWSIMLEVAGEAEAAEIEELLVEVVQQREEGEVALQA